MTRARLSAQHDPGIRALPAAPPIIIQQHADARDEPGDVAMALIVAADRAACAKAAARNAARADHGRTGPSGRSNAPARP